MSIRSRLMISLSTVFILIDALLILLKQNDIAVYFIADAIAFLVITMAYPNLNPRSRTALRYLSALIFCGFIFFAVVKMIEILN